MDNKGFEMQNDPPPYSPHENNGDVVLSASNLQNGHRNGRVSPAKDDPELAAAHEVHQKEKEKRDREPLMFVRWISNRTGLWFGENFTIIFFKIKVIPL